MSSRGSHKHCARCHIRWIDKRAAHGMCKQCKAEHTRELRQQRLAVKQRRAQREVVMPETEPTPTPVPQPKHAGGRAPRVTLSDEQKLEIVNLYLTTDTPITEIAQTYGTSQTYPYRVLETYGVSWRRGDTQPPPGLEAPHPNGVMPEAEDTVPEPIIKALENMVRMPVVPPKPEPVRQVAPPAPQPVLREGIQFEVQVSGSLTLIGLDMISVIQHVAEQYPKLRVTAVREVTR